MNVGVQGFASLPHRRRLFILITDLSAELIFDGSVSVGDWE